MKIIAPITITDSILISSNVSEAENPAWSSTGVYATGDYVNYVITNVHKVYKSLVGATSTVTMTIANPCVVTWTGVLPSVNTPVVFSTTGALPTGLTAGTVYYVLNPTGSVFNVAATVGGAAIVTTGTQSGIHTAKASANNNHNPYSDTLSSTYWIDTGATNKYKLHDVSIQSQTINATTITNSYQMSGRCNAVAALNIDAATILVKVTDSTDGIVYNKTTSLASFVGVDSWYNWFFEPIVRINNIAFIDLPAYSNSLIEITMSASSGNVGVGGLVLGNFKNIGYTQYGMKFDTQSYSTKTQDAFGNYLVVPRAYRKLLDASVMINATYVDQVLRLLTTYRDTPIVYMGSGFYEADLIYGFYRSASVVVNYRDSSLLNISIEGLT